MIDFATAALNAFQDDPVQGLTAGLLVPLMFYVMYLHREQRHEFEICRQDRLECYQVNRAMLASIAHMSRYLPDDAQRHVERAQDLVDRMDASSRDRQESFAWARAIGRLIDRLRGR